MHVCTEIIIIILSNDNGLQIRNIIECVFHEYSTNLFECQMQISTGGSHIHTKKDFGCEKNHIQHLISIILKIIGLKIAEKHLLGNLFKYIWPEMEKESR